MKSFQTTLEYFWTFASQILISLAQLTVTRFSAEILSSNDFGLFVFIRKLTSFLIPIFSLNTGQGLSRFAKMHPDESKNLFSISFLLVTAIFSISLCIIWIFNDAFHHYLFSDFADQYTPQILMIFVFANCQILLVSDFLRGCDNIKRSNLFQLAFALISIFSLLAFVLLKNGTNSIFGYLCAVSLLSLLLSFWEIKSQRIRLFELSLQSRAALLKEFFKYSLTRIPSQFIFGFIFVGPLIVVSNSSGAELLTNLGIVLTIVRLLDLLVYPINFNIVPKIAGKLGKNHQPLIKIHRLLNSLLILFMPTFAALGYGTSEILLHLVVGERYLSLTEETDWFIVSYCVYVIFLTIRATIDTVEAKPLLNYVGIAGLVTMYGTLLLVPRHTLASVLACYSVSFLVIGVTSYALFLKITKVTTAPSFFAMSIFGCLISCMTVYFVDPIIETFSHDFLVYALKIGLRFLMLVLVYVLAFKTLFSTLNPQTVFTRL